MNVRIFLSICSKSADDKESIIDTEAKAKHCDDTGTDTGYVKRFVEVDKQRQRPENNPKSD